MLTRLRGRQHQVLTGVGLVDAGSGRAVATAVVSRVLMAAYSDAMIGAYVASGSPLDKAGAYAVQDLQGALVDAVVGSYTNVVGLPVEETRRLLAGFGVPVSARTEP
jgi:septum formation protein